MEISIAKAYLRDAAASKSIDVTYLNDICTFASSKINLVDDKSWTKNEWLTLLVANISVSNHTIAKLSCQTLDRMLCHDDDDDTRSFAHFLHKSLAQDKTTFTQIACQFHLRLLGGFDIVDVTNAMRMYSPGQLGELFMNQIELIKSHETSLIRLYIHAIEVEDGQLQREIGRLVGHSTRLNDCVNKVQTTKNALEETDCVSISQMLTSIKSPPSINDIVSVLRFCQQLSIDDWIHNYSAILQLCASSPILEHLTRSIVSGARMMIGSTVRDQSQTIYTIADVRDVITAMTKYLGESATPTADSLVSATSDTEDRTKHVLFSYVIVEQWCHAVSTKSVAQWFINLHASLTDNSAHSAAWLSSDINMIISLCLPYLDQADLEKKTAACRIVLLIAEKSPLLLGSHLSNLLNVSLQLMKSMETKSSADAGDTDVFQMVEIIVKCAVQQRRHMHLTISTVALTSLSKVTERTNVDFIRVWVAALVAIVRVTPNVPHLTTLYRNTVKLSAFCQSVIIERLSQMRPTEVADSTDWMALLLKLMESTEPTVVVMAIESFGELINEQLVDLPQSVNRMCALFTKWEYEMKDDVRIAIFTVFHKSLQLAFEGYFGTEALSEAIQHAIASIVSICHKRLRNLSTTSCEVEALLFTLSALPVESMTKNLFTSATINHDDVVQWRLNITGEELINVYESLEEHKRKAFQNCIIKPCLTLELDHSKRIVTAANVEEPIVPVTSLPKLSILRAICQSKERVDFIDLLVELSTHSRMPRLDVDTIFGTSVDEKLRLAFAVGRRERLLKETIVEPDFADSKLWTSFMRPQSLDELERRFMAVAQQITDGVESPTTTSDKSIMTTLMSLIAVHYGYIPLDDFEVMTTTAVIYLHSDDAVDRLQNVLMTFMKTSTVLLERHGDGSLRELVWTMFASRPQMYSRQMVESLHVYLK